MNLTTPSSSHAHSPRFTLRFAIVITAAALACFPLAAAAQTTWNVPGDFTTIQQAINAASNGDEIVVAPGTYNEWLFINNKTLQLRSSHGPHATIVDATGSGRSAIRCRECNPENIVEGFTFTGGEGWNILGERRGGGMYNDLGSGATIINCIFTENSAHTGGGMHNHDASPTIIDCTFHNNIALTSGGGIHNTDNALPTISGSAFCENPPGNIAGPWSDLGGNVLSALCGCAASCGQPSPWGCSCDEECFSRGDCCIDICTECRLACEVIHVPSAFATIQSAIDAAIIGTEVIVAPGTYNEAVNIQGKEIHLRSSDGPEVTIIDASGLNTSVVTCESGEGPDTVLEGFTITGGDASNGGGMRNVGSSPTVIDCIFEDNAAIQGGGMYNSGSSPTVIDCVFVDNWGSSGVGMHNWGSSPTVTNCIFMNNTSGGSGGGMTNGTNSSPMVMNCLFLSNSAGYGGGGMYNSGSSPTVIDCVFEGNLAGWAGGAIYSSFNSSPIVTNSQFLSNSSEQYGGAIYNAEGSQLQAVTGSIFEGNSALVGSAIFSSVYVGAPVPVMNSSFCKNASCDIIGPWENLGGNEFCDVSAEFILVPDEYDTIQEAINAAMCQAEIVVAPGTYNEAINFYGKPIHLRSSDGPEVTIIDGSDLFASVVSCVSGEGPETILEGFTVTGGTGTDIFATHGGGMYNVGSSPTVTNCHFINNSAGIGGGMANEFESSPTITNCIFENNSTYTSGGGMDNFSSSPTVIDCLFVGNSAHSGGGMRNAGSSNPTVTNCLFINNLAQNNGGGMINFDANITLMNCVFEANSAVEGAAIWNWNALTGTVAIGDTLFCENDPDHISGPWDDLGGNEFSNECPDCPGDVNNDGVVDIFDLLDVLACWGPVDPGGPCEDADVQPDNVVDIFDLLLVLSEWGPCP